MRFTRLFSWRLSSLIVVAWLALLAQAAADDPLSAWNDGPAKQAILEFVKATTTEGSPTYVEPADRIATFDQDGTLWVEHPLYTRPREWEGRTIPDVLLSGDHKRIAEWREAQSRRITSERRPDLLARNHR